ncbi:hypothetical protein PTSG_06351 [Salpingoeca rosetta]|uniref:Solute carrier family 35 member F2 n=1 Tax=Salpingoeca rosetta (strain ATCC 50818 / BSB-021) TaxID=946362 RepID=F2UCN4_SALR5|nr:uncharacterized protein PTSG_06351 [Salpingoeca rosetta]EGD74341.1 hypothetical protein PTSG_06351 [Salpingoeca rosetta]|eukprot:XP_004993241.1 hypothetical protein PTSG_06351 [Salpingoeca rosetta]
MATVLSDAAEPTEQQQQQQQQQEQAWCGRTWRLAREHICNKDTLLVLALGQLLSLLNSGTGVTSQALATNYSVNIPTAQTFLNYALLAAVYIPIVLWKQTYRRSQADGLQAAAEEEKEATTVVIRDADEDGSDAQHMPQQSARWSVPITEAAHGQHVQHREQEQHEQEQHAQHQQHEPLLQDEEHAQLVRSDDRQSFRDFVRTVVWKYMIIAVLDVEANYVIVLAYQYTNLTSIQLLDSFTIPSAMIFSRILLKHTFSRGQYAGAALCILGIVVIVVDSFFASKHGGTNQALGDALCLLASVLYGASNVSQELMLQSRPAVEFLAFLGLFGAIINGTQLAILDREKLEGLTWSEPVVLLLVGFAVCLFLFTSMVPVLIRWSSATMLNLSLLTTDVYVMIFGVVIFAIRFSWPYIGAFAVILVGILVYHKWTPHGPLVPALSSVDRAQEVEGGEEDEEAEDGTQPLLQKMVVNAT